MLIHLKVENIGIIDSLQMEFDSGLNVLTGETGAGKSIIISAFSLLLGDRVKPSEIIKTGKETGKVTGFLQLPAEHPAADFISKSGVNISDGEILIQREISQKGKNKCLINGEVVTLGMLKELGDMLVDVHSAFDHQKILNPQTHLGYLTRFHPLDDLLTCYQDTHELWKIAVNELNKFQTEQAKNSEKKEILLFQKQELSYIEHIEGEEDELERELEILSQTTKIKEICSQANEIGIESDTSLIGHLKQFRGLVEDLAAYDKGFIDHLKELEGFSIALKDCCDYISGFSHDIHPDPNRLDEIDNVLSKIRKHKIKYGKTFSQLKEYYQRIKQELFFAETPKDPDQLKAKVEKLYLDLMKKGKLLSNGRKKAAESFKKSLEKELSDLGMSFSKIFLEFNSKEPESDGIDKLEFLIITNPGEAPKPLVSIASGGELCRIMLAFKAILSQIDDIPVLIFDEIDANIGGKTSVITGEKMCAIAHFRQIITITHQPQIAAKAKRHFAVMKTQKEDSTSTNVKLLTQEERVEEISRMLGGNEITSVVRKHAAEMLKVTI